MSEKMKAPKVRFGDLTAVSHPRLRHFLAIVFLLTVTASHGFISYFAKAGKQADFQRYWCLFGTDLSERICQSHFCEFAVAVCMLM